MNRIIRFEKIKDKRKNLYLNCAVELDNPDWAYLIAERSILQDYNFQQLNVEGDK